MAGIIDMQLMRYINLFARTTRVQTTKVFVYNNQIIFAVPKATVSIAIGKGAVNVRKLNEILRKKIKRKTARSGMAKRTPRGRKRRNRRTGRTLEHKTTTIENNKKRTKKTTEKKRK